MRNIFSRPTKISNRFSATYNQGKSLKPPLISFFKPAAYSLVLNLRLKPSPMSEPLQKRRRLQYEKCKYCRRDKKKCQPFPREWPGQKCKRCDEGGLLCSANETSKSYAQMTSRTNMAVQTQEMHNNAMLSSITDR